MLKSFKKSYVFTALTLSVRAPVGLNVDSSALSGSSHCMEQAILGTEISQSSNAACVTAPGPGSDSLGTKGFTAVRVQWVPVYLA